MKKEYGNSKKIQKRIDKFAENMQVKKLFYMVRGHF